MSSSAGGAGMLLILAGPSGAGKTTLARRLAREVPGFLFSVSTTTRPPRGGERDGEDYSFVSSAEFDRRVSRGFFLEWAEVHGHRYGTSAEWVGAALASGRSVVLDIDIRGALAVKRSQPGAVGVFVVPPSREVLSGRLSGRGTETREQFAGRMEAAALEMRWLGAFDYVVENSTLEESFALLLAIVAAESARPSARAFPRGWVQEGAAGCWNGSRVVVASGPTREYIDDVRFISNRSSGVMGCELAAAFRSAGAAVTLALGPCRAVPPRGLDLHRFESAADLARMLRRMARSCDLLAMPAAVADYRPTRRTRGKIPRAGGTFLLEMRTVEDITASLAGVCPVLSFSLEFGEGFLGRASAKMLEKGVAATFCNRGDREGEGMDAEGASGWLMAPGSDPAQIPAGSKRYVAEEIVARLPGLLGG